MTIAKKNNGSYFFSEHAASQLASRSKLTQQDVFRLIENGLSVPVGQDKHRIHTIIHSVSDNIPLVLVYDDRNKEIVTVLYMEYNNKFVISPTVAEEIRVKTVEYQQKINYLKTEWIKLNPTCKKVVLDNTVPFYFLVKRGGQFVEFKFYTCQNERINGDINNIRHIPDILLLIEKHRRQLNLKKEEIAGIGIRVEIKTNLVVIGGSKPYDKALSMIANQLRNSNKIT